MSHQFDFKNSSVVGDNMLGEEALIIAQLSVASSV
jgi:hypothetical protein